MARPRIKIDKREVEEIIMLKLEELSGVKSKLTYNNVWNFNKKIANNGKYIRENGEMYRLYGYQFWAAEYKGKAYFGKEKIDEIKSQDEFILVGKSFNADIQDIFILIDKYGKSPECLKKKLVNLFEKDRKKITFLQSENKMLQEKLRRTEDYLKRFQEGFGSMFYKSQSKNNSLKDVMTLVKSEDPIIVNELRGMFNNDLSRFQMDNEFDNIGNKVIIPLETRDKRRKELEEEGF